MILKLCENDVLLGESSRSHIMGEKIKFVRNYNDLSTDSGFQFEFFATVVVQDIGLNSRLRRAVGLEKQCPECQATISSLSKFCPECGTKC